MCEHQVQLLSEVLSFMQSVAPVGEQPNARETSVPRTSRRFRKQNILQLHHILARLATTCEPGRRQRYEVTAGRGSHYLPGDSSICLGVPGGSHEHCSFPKHCKLCKRVRNLKRLIRAFAMAYERWHIETQIAAIRVRRELMHFSVLQKPDMNCLWCTN